jgi:hypothetical protein
MPGVTARSAQKKTSRIGDARKRSNKLFADAACRGDYDDCQFGKVLKHLGGHRVSVITWDTLDTSKAPKERQAVIRNLLRKKGCTPITIDDLVVLSCREFETRSTSQEAVFDLVAVVDKKSAQRLVKDKAIPSWMAKSTSDHKAVDEDGDLFDYEALPDDYYDNCKNGEKSDSDSEVDIDKI